MARRFPRPLCPYCKNPMSPSRKPAQQSRTRDHILPREWGGTDAADNIRKVCTTCNGLRALAAHCVGVLACARAVKQRTHLSIRQILVPRQRERRHRASIGMEKP